MIVKRAAHTAFIASVIMVGVVVTASAQAFAETGTDAATEFSYQEFIDVPVKFDQAVEIARVAAKGQIVELSMDEFDGQQVYLVSLADTTSLSELVISAQNGTVIGSSVDTAASPELMEKFIQHEIEDILEFAEIMGGLMQFAVLGELSGLGDKACETDTPKN